MGEELVKVEQKIAPPMRERILALEGEMRQMPQLEIEAKHFFAKGLYARSILIPKGTTLTGKIHLYEHLNFVSGDISVMTDDGIKRITGTQVLVSQPGIKRVGFAHEDTVWTTVHACEETDVEKVELKLVCDTFEQFEQFALRGAEEKLCLS